MTLRVHPDEIVRTSMSPLLGIHPSWERVRLADVADVLNGFAFKSTAFNQTEGLPLIRIRDVGASITAVRYAGEFDERYLIEPGTIVVGMDGDFRAARWTGPPALLNQRVCTVKVRSSHLYDEPFMLFALPGYLDAVNGATSSITVKHLSSESLKELPLPLPPLAEQRRIVAAIEEQLSRLDAATSIFQVLRLRLVALERSALMHALAKGEERRLGDLLEGIEAGRSFGGARGPAGPEEWGVIRVSAMTWGDFKSDENKMVPAEDADARWEIRQGDLLLSRANTTDYVGAAVLVRETRPRLLLSDKSLRLLVKPDVDKSWLLRALSAPQSRRQISAVASGTSDSMRNVSQEKLRAITLRVPPSDCQAAIAQRIESELQRIVDLRKALNAAERRAYGLRRSILASAFRGQLVPQDPDDEPASVLLERIVAERAAASRRPRRPRETAPA